MIRSSAPLFILCMLVGCDSPKSSLGELPGDTTGVEVFETTDPTGSISASGEQSSQDIGLPCQLGGVAEAHWLEIGNAGCGSGMCLYADTITAAPQQACTEDSECTGFGQGVICGATGQCELDPEHVAARSRCTDTCVDDAECVGADGTTCEGGFACVPVAALGPACCQSVCVCRDELDVVATAELASECEAGFEVGCCAQEPLPEACDG